MRNPIFTKAESAASDLRAAGHDVEVSIHPTSWGNSAYVTARRCVDGAYIQRGFRLSDHGVGDRRKEMDEVPTVIDGDDVTVADLVFMATISDARLSALKVAQVAKREEAARKKALQDAIAQEKAEKDAARATYEADMFAARAAFIKANHPDFETLTKTKQRPIIKSFNKLYREENPE